MFTQEQLDHLIRAMRANAVTSLEVQDGERKLHLQLPAAPAPVFTPSNSAPKPINKTPIKSPSIGQFLARGQDDGLDALDLPSSVKPGDTLGYIVQGTIRVPITAPTSGQLSGSLPQSGTVFGYGDIIFNLETTS